MHENGLTFSFYEVAHAQRKCTTTKHTLIETEESKDAFIRDELSKGRYDPAIAGICFQMLLEVFGRVLRADLGPAEGAAPVEHVC
jgi:carboxymethylenebutenolidase